MIKFIFSILVILVILSLIGGAVEFQSNNESWSLIANKEAVMSSVKNGALSIYDFVKELINGSDLTAETKS